MKPKAPLSTEQYAAAATASNTKLAYQCWRALKFDQKEALVRDEY